ncbi:response regulator [Pelovirga terrestris]|uniref:Response regulator transcription factor n=1 Tax=Pelovirga terrestris TaxID=2771352 RepID=A0A8J6UNU3_9BACT|nr:response regulator transcription factor [Pelovirga terrestris]
MSNSEKTTLLAVDDDADIRTVLKANLGLHGFNVITAADLTAARNIIKSTVPALIILDLTLPDGDGLDYCEEVKAIHPQIPVIMLTARDKLQDKIIGLETGADDYVVKPFETCELLARIRARLRQTPATEPARTICAGDLLVDIGNHQVTLRGESVALTPKQFQLLTFLVENRGRLVTREEIRRTLWKDSPIYSWSRVIDVHIQHLRQKLEDDAAAPKFIVTVLGQGYRFEG